MIDSTVQPNTTMSNNISFNRGMHSYEKSMSPTKVVRMDLNKVFRNGTKHKRGESMGDSIGFNTTKTAQSGQIEPGIDKEKYYNNVGKGILKCVRNPIPSDKQLTMMAKTFDQKQKKNVT